MEYIDCCWLFLFGNLPGASFAFVPALMLGLFFSTSMLIYLYKSQTGKPLKIILIDIFRKVFFMFPSHDHSDTKRCKSANCIRCKKYAEIRIQIIKRWEIVDKDKLKSKRIDDAVDELKVDDSDDDETQEDLKENKNSFVKDSVQRPTIFYVRLPAKPCWNEFDVYQAERGLLKLNFSIIAAEFQKVFEAFQRSDTWGWKLNDIPNGHWCMFSFIDQGEIVTSNCRRCPNTSTLLLSLPSLMKDCVFGNVGFSVLYPGSCIESHCGPTNLRLRLHLGLNIPKSDCWLQVGNQKLTWSVGDMILFDDSYEHSAVFLDQKSSDESNTPRAVLLMDFWHPDVNTDEKEVLLDLLKPLPS